MARKRAAKTQDVEHYRHPEADTPMRPDVGTQARFKKKKPPQTYRFDSSLSPALEWDGQNPAREQGEALIRQILNAETLDQAKAAAANLKAMSRPFLNWAGKAERLSFDVPTLPLFVHERHSTKAIIETLVGHKRDKQQTMFDLFGDPQHSIADQVLRAYEYRDDWVNRLILGDNLVVMNSLLHYEGLGGQVQMIYMDPPYGVQFGSNFQPFVRKRDVPHGDDEVMTREPEMVKAYRDTWELGLHSYLTYLRDRLIVAREMLTSTGSIFVQISDENLHHVREIMDEVFGNDNFIAIIPFRKKTMPLGTVFIEQMHDFVLWYAKKAYDESGKRHAVYHPLYLERSVEGEFHHCWYELPDGSRHRMSKYQLFNHSLLPPGARVYRLKSLEPSGPMSSGMYNYEFDGTIYPHPQNGYGVPPEGMDRLVEARRIQPEGTRLTFVMYADEGIATRLTAPWTDTVGASEKTYVVETNPEIIRRCVLMTTAPGDLVLDPTGGSGTTAYVAEQWGRRWITIDVSRVPLALTRQRLLTATFPWYELKDQTRGPAGGFVYKRMQNSRGEEVGGIVPYITLGSIANNEPATEKFLVDRPEVTSGITRVTGPFCVEGTIPTPIDWEADGKETNGADGEANGDFSARMLEVLRRSPVLRLEGNRSITFESVRPPAKSLSLSAEANLINGQAQPVAFVFGPENGAVSELLIHEALREADLKGYKHLYVIGFAIQPNARSLIDQAGDMGSVPATYVQATPDLMMGDLLKNMRSSQIFSVCGLPEVKVHTRKDGMYQVELLGLDVFDPATMDVDHRPGHDVPAWFLDTDYNGLCFHINEAFFPRTGAWDNLKKSLKGEYDESVWDHLAGTISTLFEAGEHGQIAVKVIDDRGNELLMVKALREAR